MPHLYGDSTAFPYDVDYIELCRHAVDCAVQLMSAQHAIGAALERVQSSSEVRATEVARVVSMSEVVEQALEPFLRNDSPQTERVARRIIESAKAVCNDEIGLSNRNAGEEEAHTQNIVARSSESAQRALETFIARHDLPETDVALSWASAGEQGYSGQVFVRTPFGVSAAFSLAIPPEHPWSRARRVGDIVSGLEVHCPQQSGWLSRRVEMAPIKLDRLYLSGVSVDGARAEFRLRKNPSSGPGYRIVVEFAGNRQVFFEQFGEEGVPSTEPPLPLDGDDAQNMIKLCNAVVESMQGLAGQRKNITSMECDGIDLTSWEWPERLAERLIGHIAPVVSEISQRSGAPGELVLRRDVGGGRREEMYVTKAELYEKVLVLPPSRRAAFSTLGLGEPPPASSRVVAVAGQADAASPQAAAQ